MPAVLVLGSGMVAAPLVDYLLDECRYRVTLTDPSAERAERLIRGRAGGVALAWRAGDASVLHRAVGDVDVVVSVLPPALHLEVAQECLACRRHLVTTSYISDDMAALNEQARERDLLFLHETGESPGLDHMSVMALADRARAAGERVVSVRSFAGGLPTSGSNTNPWGYKFSWSPRGVFMAARTPAAYLERGRRIEVSPDGRIRHCRPVAIEGVGRFEAYPNRDAGRYLRPYGLGPEASLFRGLLRHEGWCRTIHALGTLGLLDDTVTHRTGGMTHGRFLASLLRCQEGRVRVEAARRLGVNVADPVLSRLEWLGLFGDTPVACARGTALDVFLERAVQMLRYAPGEHDMVVVHTEVVGTKDGASTCRTATLVAEGTFPENSAMSCAVGLTAGIATRLVIEGAVGLRGVSGPFSHDIFGPVLDEMAAHGFRFTFSESRMPSLS